MENPNNILESSGSEEINGNNKDQKLESAKRVMGEVREENERLKLSLAHVASDDEESEFVSLSLGISPKGQHEKKNSNRSTQKVREDEDLNKGLGLGLDIRFDPYSADQIQSRCDEKRKEEELSEIWPPSKVLKTTKSGDKSEASQHTEPKKARVCIRARCDTHTMNDGCQWRKYGQKMAKGNPCPRAYYRCTISPSCPVRKQVQRCAQDMSILITTYEGTHNHPLPNSATTIANTTSAAASMLQSPSLTSQANSNTIPLINSLNFTSNIHQFSKPQQFYFHNSNSHRTITLDLTTPHIEKFTPSLSFMPKYSSTNFNFSPSTISPLQSSMPNQPWSPYNDNFNNVGMITQNRNQIGSLMNNGKQPFQGHLYQPNYTRNYAFSQQPLLPDSIESAAITTHPKFQFALATALRTYVGNEGASGEVKENHVGAEGDALKLNVGGDMPYTMNTVYTCKASSRYRRMSSPTPNAPKGIFPSPQASKNNQFSDQWKSNNVHITPFDSSLLKRLDMVNNEEA